MKRKALEAGSSQPDKARKAAQRRANKRRADWKRIDSILERADHLINARRIASINPLGSLPGLKEELAAELKKLRLKTKEKMRKKDANICELYANRISEISKKIDDLERGLIKESAVRSNSAMEGLVNRRLTAKVVGRHPLGDVVGRTAIVDYKAPSSTVVWATPKRKK